MTLILLAGVAVGAGLAAILLAEGWRQLAFAVGLVGAVAVLVIAWTMPVDETVLIGGVGLVITPLVKSMAVAWAAGLVVLGLLEVGIGGRPVVVGPSLVGLAVAALALGTRDPQSSVAALAAGGVACVVVPGLNGWLDGSASVARLAETSRGTLAVIGSGLLAVAVIAWGASPAGPLGTTGVSGTDPNSRLVLGLALIAMVTAVAIRCGLIPLHVWAARFMEGVTPLAIPAAFSWGSAAFVLAALDSSQNTLGPSAAGDAERLVVITVAMVSVVLGGAAAMLHDDIEHVLGYSILQDAGVAVLAFASLEPEAATFAGSWLVASATVKTALAAWAAVVRFTYGGHRLAELGGWARQSPALGIAFAAILISAIGLPGTALFDARIGLMAGPLAGIGPLLAIAIAAMPAIYLGRIGRAGLEPVSLAVAAAPNGRLSWKGGRASGWSVGPLAEAIRAVPAELRANRAPLMAVGVLALAAMGVLSSLGGVGA